jgi:FkbM family methyltransferase
VGANYGHYTLALAKRFNRVVAFEINEQITVALRQHNRANVEVIHCGLSSEPAQSRLFIPVSDGLALAGWASLNRDNLPGAEELLEIEATLKRLDDFGFAKVDFIKIDVEGHEIEVLKGAAKTIEAGRPIVLVELKKEHVREVDSWFKQFEYKHCRLEDFTGLSGHRSNHIYVPAEKLAKFGIARPLE